MKKILILSCGTNSAYHFIKIMSNNKNDFYIVGTDINEPYLVPSINFLDKFYKVPKSDENSFYKNILDILISEKIDLIIPIFDFDQKVFNKDNKDLKYYGIKTLAPSKNVFDFYGNKIKLSKLLNENDIPVPLSYNFNKISDNELYFIKPIDGVGSFGSRILSGKCIKKLENVENIIIQEICTAPEITLECFRYGKNLATVARERIETKAGVCTKTCVYHNVELENIANKFINIIDTPNIFNLQFMKNNQDKYVVTDVNFRFAGGMALSHKAGWDESSALIALILDRPEKEIFSNLKLNFEKQWIVRVYDEIITKQI